MALLHEINNGTERFSVDDQGAIKFNNAYQFPVADGSLNYVLKTNGAGTLNWAADTGGTVTGSGTGQKVTKWTGSGASTVLDDGPITFATNDSTFAGKIITTAIQPSYDTNYYNVDSTIYFLILLL